MTNFDKIRQYYNEFNEDERLINDNSGKLEFEMTMRILNKYLPHGVNKGNHYYMKKLLYYFCKKFQERKTWKNQVLKT